jgi:hypothetical protein
VEPAYFLRPRIIVPGLGKMATPSPLKGAQKFSPLPPPPRMPIDELRSKISAKKPPP